MSVDPSGRATACFDLKRTTYPLLSLVLRTTDLADLQRELQARLGDSPEFFNQDLLVVNLASVQADDDEIDFVALVALLRRYCVQPIGAHGGSEAQMRGAAEAGLVPAPDISAAGSMARAARPAPPQAQSESQAPASQSASPPADAVVIDKPLRSGQRVYAKGADLVVVSLVSFGAEIFADGNIHVYAPLRGRAVAGARGNASARIFSTCLEPQLVAIAGVYRTIETPLPADVAGKPAQVRRVGDSLVIEPL